MIAADDNGLPASSLDRTSAPAFKISAGVLALVGVGLFQFFGNATRGYIHSASLFYWLSAQWSDPAADASQGPLVLLVASALWVWNRFRFSAYSKTGDARGFSLIAGALAVHALGYATQQTRLSVIACLIFVAGLCALANGQRGLRAARFPLSFALLAIPVGFLQPWGFSLRLAISKSVEMILRASGHPIVRDGTQLFSLDGRQAYDVEAACSGIHSLVALIALAILLGYLRFSRWPRKAILVALVAPFAFVGNLIRVLSIVVAGEKFGPHAAQRIHTWSGFVVFAVVFALLWVAMRWLETRSPTQAMVQPAPASEPPQAERTASAAGVTVWTSLLLVEVVLVAVALHGLNSRPAAQAGVKVAEDGVNPIALPEFLGTEWVGQRVDVTAVERSILPPDTGYSRRNYVSVADRSQQVFVSVVLSGQDRTSIHRPELCLVGQGWVVEKSERAEFFVGETLPVTLLHLRRDAWTRAGERHVLSALFAYAFVSEDEVDATHAGMLWRNAVHRLRHLRGERWAYVVAQTLLSDQVAVTEKTATPSNVSAPGEQAERLATRRMETVLRPVWITLRK